MSFSPSAKLGETVSDLIFYGTKEKNAALDANSRLFKIISEELNNNPKYVSSANTFLNTKVMPDDLVGTKLEQYLLEFQKIKEPLQRSALGQIKTQKFINISNARQRNLINTIEESLESESPEYLRRDYKLFLDPDFVPNDNLRRAAIQELKKAIYKNHQQIKNHCLLKKQKKEQQDILIDFLLCLLNQDLKLINTLECQQTVF